VIYGSQYRGGKAFNSVAFTPSPSGQQDDFGRNVLGGFGAWQDDFAVQRQFHINEDLGLVSEESSLTSSTTPTLALRPTT
jgi:hypothetical protein